MTKEALSQVIRETGDLNSGRFHFISAIHSLHCGLFIQLFQILLGWKRIWGSDVGKCYQHAAGLAMMTSDGLEK